MQNKDDIFRLLEKGYILYKDCGIIKSKERVDYGKISFSFRDGKCYQSETLSTTKEV
ncbi:hypothetical protein ACMZ62_07095 [Streptococcus pluranimalium]